MGGLQLYYTESVNNIFSLKSALWQFLNLKFLAKIKYDPVTKGKGGLVTRPTP